MYRRFVVKDEKRLDEAEKLINEKQLSRDELILLLEVFTLSRTY